MRRPATLAAGILAASTALVACVPFASAATRNCSPVPDVLPTGVQSAWAVQVRATNTTCRIARTLPAKVIQNFRYGAMNPERYGAQALGIAAWTCDDHGGNGGWNAPVTCTASGGRKVSWRLADHP